MDFSTINLNKEELAFLKKLSKRDCLDDKSLKIRYILEKGLVLWTMSSHNIDGNTVNKRWLIISDYGRKYLSYYKDLRYSKIRTEIREWITPVIAVLALLLSIISLYWQGVTTGFITW